MLSQHLSFNLAPSLYQIQAFVFLVYFMNGFFPDVSPSLNFSWDKQNDKITLPLLSCPFFFSIFGTEKMVSLSFLAVVKLSRKSKTHFEDYSTVDSIYHLDVKKSRLGGFFFLNELWIIYWIYNETAFKYSCKGFFACVQSQLCCSVSQTVSQSVN